MADKRITCAECRFWHSDSTLGQCRYDPPVVMYSCIAGLRSSESPETWFPVTNATEWCGKAEAANG